jgi:hypothetical protein
MYLLQGLIVFAVVGSNIHWQWTENLVPAVLGLLLAGLLLAWLVTMVIVTVRDHIGR